MLIQPLPYHLAAAGRLNIQPLRDLLHSRLKEALPRDADGAKWEACLLGIVDAERQAGRLAEFVGTTNRLVLLATSTSCMIAAVVKPVTPMQWSESNDLKAAIVELAAGLSSGTSCACALRRWLLSCGRAQPWVRQPGHHRGPRPALSLVERRWRYCPRQPPRQQHW